MNAPRHHRPSEAEAIAASAAAWLAQRDDGLTPEQATEFARWREADARHEAAVVRLEATWTALQQLREYRPEAVRHPDGDLLRHHAANRRQRLPVLAATAAVAASLAAASLWWYAAERHPGHARAPTYVTTDGGYERVALSDGSTVELNSASEISVLFSRTERRVRLVRGEAHFTVRRDPAMPFRVEAEGITVSALGTAFNVRLDARDVEVLVTEGQVAVGKLERVAVTSATRPSDPEGSRGAPPASAASAVVSANERIVIPAALAATVGTIVLPGVEKVAPEAVREALAWQSSRLVFVNTPLVEAIAFFNRRNSVQLELADPDLYALPIGGSFRAENVDAFVRLFASSGDVVVERPSPDRIVLRRAPRATSRD